MMRKTRVRLGMGIAAAAAALAVVIPAAHATEGHHVEDGAAASAQAPFPGIALDAWGTRDLDMSFGSAMVQHFIPWAQAHDKFV